MQVFNSYISIKWLNSLDTRKIKEFIVAYILLRAKIFLDLIN